MFSSCQKQNKQKNGFTLLEVMGAMFVVSIGIIGIFSLTTQTISLIDISADRLTAAYLVQEGIETMRNMRDANILKGDNWDKDISADSSYELDSQSQRFPDNTCNLASGNYLKYNSTSKLFNCSTGDASRFKRLVTITKASTSTMNVVVRVEWFSKNKTHQITGQGNLYDWQ